jgi:hypothetical protein
LAAAGGGGLAAVQPVILQQKATAGDGSGMEIVWPQP